MKIADPTSISSSPSMLSGLPPLVDGDRLTREEFHRRYEAMPESIHAELIDGVVYMSSPANDGYHGEPHSDLSGWLFLYKSQTPGIHSGSGSSVFLDGFNEIQPDCLLRLAPEKGGQASRDDKGNLTSLPELLVEVSNSSVKLDTTKKKDVYLRQGAKEYIVWRVRERQIDWFVNRNGLFELLPLSPEGWYKSTVFPGLWLDPHALIDQDLGKVVRVSQLGLDSPEHRLFVEGMK